jgi:hypothetical protein
MKMTRQKARARESHESAQRFVLERSCFTVLERSCLVNDRRGDSTRSRHGSCC